MSKILYGCDLESLPYCCGMYEAGNFRETNIVRTDYSSPKPEELVEKVLANANGRPVVFNFVRIRDEGTGELNEEFEDAKLRNAVAKHKHAISIGTWINPGSNNEIDCYIIKGYK